MTEDDRKRVAEIRALHARSAKMPALDATVHHSKVHAMIGVLLTALDAAEAERDAARREALEEAIAVVERPGGLWSTHVLRNNIALELRALRDRKPDGGA